MKKFYDVSLKIPKAVRTLIAIAPTLVAIILFCVNSIVGGAVFAVIAVAALLWLSACEKKEKKRAEDARKSATAENNIIFQQSETKVDTCELPIRTKIRGATFEGRQAFIAESKMNDKLLIRHTPQPDYPDTIFVTNIRTGKIIGCVSAELSKSLIRVFGKNCIFNGRILDVTGGTDGQIFGCNFIITQINK